MKQKLLLSVSIMAVGLIIITGGVLAKDSIFEQVLIEEKSPVAKLIGEAIGFTADDSQALEVEVGRERNGPDQMWCRDERKVANCPVRCADNTGNAVQEANVRTR